MKNTVSRAKIAKFNPALGIDLIQNCFSIFSRILGWSRKLQLFSSLRKPASPTEINSPFLHSKEGFIRDDEKEI